MTANDDELLISLVSARPPLYDFRIPLKERCRDVVNNLWEEVISELNSKYLNISINFLKSVLSIFS